MNYDPCANLRRSTTVPAKKRTLFMCASQNYSRIRVMCTVFSDSSDSVAVTRKRAEGWDTLFHLTHSDPWKYLDDVARDDKLYAETQKGRVRIKWEEVTEERMRVK